MKVLLLCVFGVTLVIGLCISFLLVVLLRILGALLRIRWKPIANSIFLHCTFYFPILVISPFLSIETNFSKQTPSVFICNHRHELDIFFLIYSLKQASIPLSRVFFWIRKDQLHFPVIGWCFFLLGYPFIDFAIGNKPNGKTVATAMEQTKCWIENQQGIVLIFPEGLLNTSPTMSLLPFKNGVFSLTQELELPLLGVVVMRDTKTVLQKKRLLVAIQCIPSLGDTIESKKMHFWEAMNKMLMSK